MLQDIDLIVPWLVISNVGQCCLLILLVTYAFAPWLSQRNNVYLLNFILVTFLGCVPPSLLFYTGHLYSDISSGLCLAQATLVVGVPPMLAMVQLALAFDSWSELRSLCVYTGHVSRITFVKCIALIAPYVTLTVWTVAAYKAALSNSLYKADKVASAKYVFCRTPGEPSRNVMLGTSVFMIVLTAIQVFFELWVAWMIYAYPSKEPSDIATWQTTIQFSLRVIIFSMLQLITICLTVMDIHSDALKRANELLAPMNPVVAFLVIGAQTNVLLTWKYALLRVWDFVTRKKPESQDELQPQGRPGLDWASVPQRYVLANAQPVDAGDKYQDEEVEGGLVGKKLMLRGSTRFLKRLKKFVVWERTVERGHYTNGRTVPDALKANH
ncbi:hypothetical protein JB92DRAFT_3100490 [Gautieria morchelliformis]|nr:hypothetical protein JB92DRAFT_3100490 [Gautieria morchelliformis]